MPAAGACFVSACVLGVALTLLLWLAAAPVMDVFRVLGAAAFGALEMRRSILSLASVQV